MSKDERMEAMLFDYATTYRTDYQSHEFTACAPTIYKEKPKKQNEKQLGWKAPLVPFDLMLKRKEIVRTHPRSLQQRFEKPVDTGREAAQATRPRRVMTPAVSMDDISDTAARDVLCRDMYTSCAMRAAREGAAPCANVTAPLPALPSPSNPVVLPKLQLPVVSPEWRMETVSWDGRQLRAFCDPTKDFWLRHELNNCRACDETAAVKAHRKMQSQLKSGH